METERKSNDQLLDKVIQRQQQHQLSDYKFAARLGVIRTLWQLTRTHQRSIGLTLLRAILRTYPDLTNDVLAFMKDTNHEHK